MVVFLIILLVMCNLNAIDQTPDGKSCQQLLKNTFIPRPPARNNAQVDVNTGALAISLSCAALVGSCLGHTVLPINHRWPPELEYVHTPFRCFVGANAGLASALFLLLRPSIARAVNATYAAFIRSLDERANQFLD